MIVGVGIVVVMGGIVVTGCAVSIVFFFVAISIVVSVRVLGMKIVIGSSISRVFVVVIFVVSGGSADAIIGAVSQRGYRNQRK